MYRTVAIASAFEDDASPNKINICTPGYRDETGKLFVPPTVRYAEKQFHSESMVSREALPIEGHAPFLDAGVKFAYGGDSHPYRHKRVNLILVIQPYKGRADQFPGRCCSSCFSHGCSSSRWNVPLSLPYTSSHQDGLYPFSNY